MHVCRSNTIAWEQLLAATRDHQTKRIAWRLLRQFVEPYACEAEFGIEPDCHWTVAGFPSSASADTIKLLLSNERGVRCETVVLLPQGHGTAASKKTPRATACVSSQPGCGVACPFCSTATLGYRGNLTACEIIEQVYWSGCMARRLGRKLRNVVFMGMGEPLHNSAAVFEALAWLVSPDGFGLSPRHITVSTAGVPAAMLELARLFPRVRLALSLHAAEPHLRKQLVPKAVSDLQLLRQTIVEVSKLQTQPVWLECVMFAGLNDTQEHAALLVDFCRGLRVEVNLIPYNVAANSEKFQASSRVRREAFAQRVRDAGIRTTIRNSLGSDRQAACGQLVAKSTNS